MPEKISVITVVFNDSTHIEKTIQSVLSQNYSNVEYIIIDGASTDGTLEICKKYENQISKIISEKDTGIYNAMNKGIQNSTGEWIFFLNSGDIFFNDNAISSVMSETINADIIYGKAMTDNKEETFFSKRITKSMFILERMICHQAIFARRKVFDNNNFDEKYRIIADRVWLYNCYKQKYLIKPLEKTISVYDTSGVSSNIEKFDKESLAFLKSISVLWFVFAKIKRIFRIIKINK